MSGSTMTWCVAPVAPPSPAVMAAATRAPNARESSSAPRPGSSSTAAAAAAAAVVSQVASAVAVAAAAVLAAAALSAADRGVGLGGAAEPSARHSPSGAVWRGSQRRQLSSPQRQRVWLRSCPLSAAPSAVPPTARPEDSPGRARPMRWVSLSISPAPTAEEPSA